MWAVAVMCGSVAVMGGCTSDEGGASAGDSSSPQATGSLLSRVEVAAALGESVSGEGGALEQDWCLVPGPAVGWDASTFYTLVRGDERVTTDVSECTITSADPQTITQMYADLEGQTPEGAEGPYEPATIGVEAFAWELDGLGGAIDRFVVVTTGDALVGIAANRHSPVAEGDNLTREQVDNLVKAAVDKLGQDPGVAEQSPSSGAGGTAADSPSVLTERVGSFQVVQSADGVWGWGMPAEAATVMLPVTWAGEYRAEDDPCTPPNIPNLSGPEVRGLEGLGESGQREGPNGVRVVYRGQAAELQEAFASIAEQMAQCAAEMPFQEQGREGVFQVQMLDIAALGDEQVAARVSDVGPNSMEEGWTAQYYWVGFARDGDTLAGVQLYEGWDGSGAEDWPKQYPQPTVADEELATQLDAALASTG